MSLIDEVSRRERSPQEQLEAASKLYAYLHKLLVIGTMAKLELTSPEEASGFNNVKNILILSYAQAFLTDAEMGIPSCPFEPVNWQVDLVHELIHEYQYKITKQRPVSPAAEKLMESHKRKWPGSGHDVTFYQAIICVASVLGLQPAQLMRSI